MLITSPVISWFVVSFHIYHICHVETHKFNKMDTTRLLVVSVILLFGTVSSSRYPYIQYSGDKDSDVTWNLAFEDTFDGTSLVCLCSCCISCRCCRILTCINIHKRTQRRIQTNGRSSLEVVTLPMVLCIGTMKVLLSIMV